MRLRLITYNRVFDARIVTIEQGIRTVIYEEGNTTNWIRITPYLVVICINGRLRYVP